MQQFEPLPERMLRGAYMPVGVADELIGLLLRLRALLADASLAGLGPVTLAGGYTIGDAELALNLVLAEVEHLLDLADHCNVQVSAERWEWVTDDLRGLVLTIAARV